MNEPETYLRLTIAPETPVESFAKMDWTKRQGCLVMLPGMVLSDKPP